MTTLPLTYTIDENNVVSMFSTQYPNEDGSPSVLQPFDPRTNQPFVSKEAATAWAEEIIERKLNPVKEDEEVQEEAPAES